jgi:hypothetical protein
VVDGIVMYELDGVISGLLDDGPDVTFVSRRDGLLTGETGCVV